LTIVFFGDPGNMLTAAIRDELEHSPLVIAMRFVGPNDSLADIGEPDLIISAAYPSILPDAILRRARMAAVNIHPSLLPKYRGVNPVAWALLDEAPKVGVTIHQMVAEPDAGPIAVQHPMLVQAGESLQHLNERVIKEARVALIEILVQASQNGEIPAIPQEGSPILRRRADKELHRLEIDASLTAQEIERRVNLFPTLINFWTSSARYGLWKVSVSKKRSNARPGKVISTGLAVNVVCAQNTVLAIKRVTGATLPRRSLVVEGLRNVWFRIRYLPGTRLFAFRREE
jgi:methionyl-tRNA formyltransferase